jgi:hypothetical protein
MKRISLSMLYLYAVGVVLVLGLFMPFDAHAGNFNLCVNGQSIYGGGTCGTTANAQPTQPTQPNNQQYVLRGNQALHVLTRLDWYHGRGPTQSVDTNGTYFVVGRYVGNRFSVIRNRVFTCKVAVNAQQFQCNSWPVDPQ